MQAGEIAELARQFTELGVKKIRLTGGEPLVRKDAADILLSLSRLPVKLTMTTNATRLHLFTDILQASGIRSLNVSLDTLQEDRFRLITRRDQFQIVIDNIGLLSALRRGEDIRSLIATNVLNKKEKLGGQFTNTFELLEADGLVNRSMITTIWSPPGLSLYLH